MRHIVGKLSTSSFQRYKVCANRSSDEGVMAPGSRGVGAVFVHSSGEDSGQTGDAIGEPRVPRRSRSHYLSNAPGLADQLVASRKDSAREGGSCAAYFCKVPDSRESELGLVRYGPASRVHRGVFGPFEGSFPIRIPADPDKFLAIREFHVVHGCVLFPMCPGSTHPGLWINLLRVRKTLCASVATSVRKIPGTFSTNLILSACFHARGRRSSRCRISDDLGIVGKLACYLLFNGVVSSIQFLVWSTVRSNLGQTWSTLVKLGRNLVKTLQTLGNVSRTSFRGFLGKVDPSRAGKRLGQTSVKLRSTLVKLGQPWSNLGKCVKPWSNLGKCVPDLLGVFDAKLRRIIGLAESASNAQGQDPPQPPPVDPNREVLPMNLMLELIRACSRFKVSWQKLQAQRKRCWCENPSSKRRGKSGKTSSDLSSHNKEITFVTLFDVADLLKQEREKNPKEPRHFVRRPPYPTELLKQPYLEKYIVPTFSRFDDRKGSALVPLASS
uniref:Uncharacterized protein n=1 Tax=Fagus sylvatica TaxID=28930 RepID=A0A2N9HDL7_FAGSY